MTTNRNELLKQKQEKSYQRVNNLYVNKNITLENACKKVGISKKTYYNYKKKFDNKKMITAERIIGEKSVEMVQKAGNNKKMITPERIICEKSVEMVQKGGNNKNINNIEANVNKDTNRITENDINPEAKKLAETIRGFCIDESEKD